MLKLNNISKSFGSRELGNLRVVLDDVDLEINKGDTISILGPSGSGKSTLLNIIGSLDKPDSGEVVFDGESINTKAENQLSLFRNNEIGFIFQLHHLLPQCTVLENVLIPVLPVKNPDYRKESYQRALDLIKKVGLWDQRDQHPDVLSGGECQRVAVIRALINQPRLLLADEPTGSLDHDNALSIASLLLELNKESDTALLVVTHSNDIASMMDHTYTLNNGKLENNVKSK
ncbi:ABC transporter ATP-binding protein [Bacteroidota bacterium]